MNLTELCIGIYSLIEHNTKSGNDCEIDADLEKKICTCMCMRSFLREIDG